MYTRLLNELRHRRVLRTAALYAAVAIAVMEGADIVIPALGLPEWLLTVVIIVALTGFPVVMALAWYFDLSSRGVVRGTSSPQPTVPSGGWSQALSWLLVMVLAVAVAYLSYRLYWEAGGPGVPGDSSGPASATLVRGKSIAVLPFSNITAESEPDTGYFSDGVAEEILSALTNVEGLRVAARTSSFAFREGYDVRSVGEALDVSVVLEGSVRRAGNRLRVSAQLVDTGNGFQLWSRVFDYELRDVFRIQEEISESIVEALELELLADSGASLMQPGTDSIEAYDLYLRGRHLLQQRTPATANDAIALFQQALDLEPDYAQAYTGLADAWLVLRDVGNLTLIEATEQSHDAISRALQLNNLLPEAQTSLGLCILGGGDHAGAARQFERAIELDPEHADAYMWRANVLREQGYLAAAVPVYTQALALDPLNPAVLENQALLFAYQGRFERAVEQLENVTRENPGRLTAALAMAEVRALAGDYDGALEAAERARELAPESPVALTAMVDGSLRLGHLEEAEAIIEAARERAPDNETVLRTTLRYYLISGRYAELDALARKRAESISGIPGARGTAIHLERLTWAATARLVLGDAAGAYELLEEALPEPRRLDPRPASVHHLALLVRATALEGDREALGPLVESARELAERTRAEGWGGAQLEYSLAAVTAAADAHQEALDHLGAAIDAGWRDVTFAEHDPAIAQLRELPEYRALLEKRGQTLQPVPVYSM